jgi:hypothetical protein
MGEVGPGRLSGRGTGMRTGVMTLDKSWNFILSVALIGFLVAMLAGCCMDFNAPNVITNLMLLISPRFVVLSAKSIWQRRVCQLPHCLVV